MNEKQYEALLTKGFNAGYIMSRYEPKLYQEVIKGCDQTKPYFAGMIKGHQAAERDVFLQNLKTARQINQHVKPKPR